MKEQRKRWREKKKERQPQTENERREAVKERSRETKKKWRANNKEIVTAYQRKYRERHREAVNEASRRRYHACKEQRCEIVENNQDKVRARREACRERSRRYRQKHKDRIREAKRKWWANNPDKVTVLNGKRRQRHRANKTVLEKDPPPLPCDCGVCLSCGGVEHLVEVRMARTI